MQDTTLVRQTVGEYARNPNGERQSVDEQMVPFEDRLGFKQYMKDKPFTRAKASGKCMISKSIAEKEPPSGLFFCFGADMVQRLVEHLPKKQNFKIFFVNFTAAFISLKIFSK
ncbi:hypothetical protein QYM36_006548 [Artemia franciscana]|uniref:Uncharacterized protein n=1 Tax=Artemia franciscana TaxID=6661 RepID=A0AA88HVD5_ARTSF|nr:hypothetical protein QYM36_006548 [Artemia franciscana]